MNEYRNNYLGFDIYLEEHFEDIKVLNQIIKGYTGKYMVFDKFDFWQIDKPFNTKDEALDYIGNLLNVKNKQEYNYLKWCTKGNIKENSIIQFEDDTQGVVLGSEHADGNIKYNPIKKDGIPGKAIRRLYGNMNYKVIKY